MEHVLSDVRRINGLLNGCLLLNAGSLSLKALFKGVQVHSTQTKIILVVYIILLQKYFWGIYQK